MLKPTQDRILMTPLSNPELVDSNSPTNSDEMRPLAAYRIIEVGPKVTEIKKDQIVYCGDWVESIQVGDQLFSLCWESEIKLVFED